MKRWAKYGYALVMTLPALAVQAQYDQDPVPTGDTSGANTQSHSQTSASPASATPDAGAAAPNTTPPSDAGATGGDAASSGEVTKKKSSGNRLVEEIVVTAQKREEKLMDVPISVQAFSAENLDARGITDTAGLMKATPGLDIGTQAGFTSVFLRGVGTDAWLTADPSIAAYVDGVYYPFSPSIVQDLGAVQRVEVLKGPQGTLFGRNAVGGAINTITKAPDFEDSETSISSSYGNYNTLKSRIYTNVPITDTLAINVSGVYNSGDSFLTQSTIAGHKLNEEVTEAARVKVRWDPIENLDLNFMGIHTHQQNNGAFPVNLNPSPLGTLLGVTPAGHYDSHTDTALYLRNEQTTLAGQGTYNAPWFDVKLLGSTQKNSQPYNYDFDGSDKPLVSFDIPVHFSNVQEGEIQLLSNKKFGPDWLTVTAGAFIFKSLQGFNPIKVTVADLNPADLGAIGITLPPSLQGALNGLFGPLSPQFPLYTVTDTALVDTNSLSEYLQTTFRMADWVSLTLGGRYQSENRGVYQSNTRLTVYDPAAPGGHMDLPLITWTTARTSSGAPFPLYHTTKSFKPKVGLDFHPFEDDTLVYMTYQQAEKAHAYNAYAIYLPPAYVRPEKTVAYETGVKSTLFDGAMRVSAAAFWYDMKDVQTQFVSLINGGAVSFENAPRARSRGFDFDITSSIFPSIIDGLAVTLNGCLLDAKYTDYPDGAGYAPPTELFSHTNDYTGKRIVRSPKFSGSFTPSKSWDVPGGSFEISGDVYYNSGFFYTASNDPNYEQPKYITVGARVSYLYQPWNLRATFAGRNITNTFYTAGLIATDFGSNYSVAAPAEYNLKLDWNF